MEDPKIVMREMHRVLKSNGRALILEFSLPSNNILKLIHLFYLRHVVAFIGAIFSGNGQAYRYLNQTIEKFPYGEEFCKTFSHCGFMNVKAHPLLFGIASIYQGEKI